MTQSSELAIASETARLHKLKSFGILDTPAEADFNAIVEVAQRLFNIPMVGVSMVDEHRQWFKAHCGFNASETPRKFSFCAHALSVEDMLVVEDATCDPRFCTNPYVTAGAGIRFYAGVPLHPVADGFAGDLAGIGTLCILDTKPRPFTQEDRASLSHLANLVTSLISARTVAANAVRSSEELARHALDLSRQHVQLRQAERMANLGSWRLDLLTRTLVWSDQVFAIYGLQLGSIPSFEEAMSAFPSNRRAEIAALVERAATHGEAFDFESDFRTADGRLRRVRSMGELLSNNGHAPALIGLFQDITAAHVREQELRLSADTDGLTGLPNRMRYERELTDIVEQVHRTAMPAYLLMLDLDGFKSVNDTFGHATGDEVLQTVADQLRRISHNQHFIARLGGDEFVAIVTRPRDCASIEHVIENMLNELCQTVEKNGQRRSISATIGAAIIDASVRQTSELMRQADLALYHAKRSRRGSGRIHGSGTIIVPRGPKRRVA